MVQAQKGVTFSGDRAFQRQTDFQGSRGSGRSWAIRSCIGSAGNINDCVAGYDILDTLDLEGKQVMADRGCDTDRILTFLKRDER